MDSRVDFVACDMPEANRLTLHILAAVAEHERELISQRTRAALAAAKRRGTRLGNPTPGLALQRARAALVAAADGFAANARPLIQDLRAAGLGLRAIARELNRRGVPTARGREWQASTVRNVLHRG